MSAEVIQRVIELLGEKLSSPELEDYFLVDLQLSASNKLEVFLDSDNEVSFSTCREISRFLEQYLDEEKWLGEKYTLDVSSAGVGKPLKLMRQYQKNIGRKLKVKMTDGEEKTGILKQAGPENSILIESTERIKEGKRKKTIKIETEIDLDAIKKAVVQISFK